MSLLKLPFQRVSQTYLTKSSVIKSFLKNLSKIKLNKAHKFYLKGHNNTRNVGKMEPKILIGGLFGKTFVESLGWWTNGGSDK